MKKNYLRLLIVCLLLPSVQVAIPTAGAQTAVASADEFDPKTWMADASVEARSNLLSEFIIPGSHDALTYDLITVPACSAAQRKAEGGRCKNVPLVAERLPWVGVKPWAQAQDLTIKQQLEAGARSFDLRFFEVTEAWQNELGFLRWLQVDDRDIEAGDYITHHTLAGGTKSTEIFKDIRAFAKKHPREILVLNFRSIEVEDKNVFFQHVSDGLDLPTNGIAGSVWNKPVSDLQDGPGNIVSTYDWLEKIGSLTCDACDRIIKNPEAHNLGTLKSKGYLLEEDSDEIFKGYPWADKYATEPALIALLQGLDDSQKYHLEDNVGTRLTPAIGLPEDSNRALTLIVNPLLPGSIEEIAAGPADECYGCGINEKLVPALTVLPRDHVNMLWFDYYSEDITREIAKLNEDPIRVAVHILKVEENDCNSSPLATSKPNCIDPSGYPDFYPKVNFSPDEGWGEWGGVELENTDRWADSDKGNGDPKPSDEIWNDWTFQTAGFLPYQVQIGPWIARRALDITETSVEVDIKIRDEDIGSNDHPTINGGRRSIVKTFDLSKCVSDPDDCGLTRKTYTKSGSRWEYDCGFFGCSTKAGVKIKYLVQVCRWSSCEEITDVGDWIEAGKNEAPVAALDKEVYTVDEGSPLSVDGSGTSDPDDDPLSYVWELNDPQSCSDIPADEPRIQADYVCADDESFEIKLTVSDEEFSDTASASVVVNNVVPTATAVGGVIDEDGVATVSGTITDPGRLDTFDIEIDWGEGGPVSYAYPAGTTVFSETHRYLDDNPTATASDVYTINVVVTDDDGGKGSAQTTVTVDNVAPLITELASSATFDDNVEEEDTVTVSGSFTDVGTLDTHTVLIDWGDHSTSPAVVTQGTGTGTFTADHAYSAGGVYTVTVTLTDDDTGVDTDNTIAVVTGVGINGDVLQVVGTHGNDLAVIKAVRTEIDVFASFVSPKHRRFDLTEVAAIEVWLREGNDRGAVHRSIHLPVTIHGGTGDDMMWGGSGDDFIEGGHGNDKLWGRDGADELYGNDGDDQVRGDKGVDILDGGPGKNSLRQ
jgi:hypothetical protein